MKAKCPYCGAPCVISEPAMSPRKTRIYRAVVASGPSGISTASLLGQMYEFGEKPTRGGPTVLRVQIHDINMKLMAFNQRIQARPRGRYRLVSTVEKG